MRAVLWLCSGTSCSLVLGSSGPWGVASEGGGGREVHACRRVVKQPLLRLFMLTSTYSGYAHGVILYFMYK